MDSAGQDLEVHLRLLRGEDSDARKSPAGEWGTADFKLRSALERTGGKKLTRVPRAVAL